MRIGTSYFKSIGTAACYFEASREEIEEKVAEGLIHIGEPPLKKGQYLEYNPTEGRYFINE